MQSRAVCCFGITAVILAGVGVGLFLKLKPGAVPGISDARVRSATGCCSFLDVDGATIAKKRPDLTMHLQVCSVSKSALTVLVAVKNNGPTTRYVFPIALGDCELQARDATGESFRLNYGSPGTRPNKELDEMTRLAPDNGLTGKLTVTLTSEMEAKLRGGTIRAAMLGAFRKSRTDDSTGFISLESPWLKTIAAN